ncbi:MAG: DUF952 domain-containing protein [Sedimentisphaerales bacterium]|nr:DUF952 domain-containing protein [Sedimentisphaerales bacterium]
MSTILHITKRLEWEKAQATGRYEADSFHTQGFIHCSTPDQIIEVANFLFRGQTDLVLLHIDTDKLTSPVRYENLENGKTLFPHIYGPLNLEAVTEARDFPPRCDGTFAL